MVILSGSLGSILKHKGLVLTCFLLGSISTLFYSIAKTPIYEAQALLVVIPNQADKDLSSPLRQADILNSKVQIARSKEVLRRSVQQFGAQKLQIPDRSSGSIASLSNYILNHTEEKAQSSSNTESGGKKVIVGGQNSTASDASDNEDNLLKRVEASLVTRVLPNSDIISIQYRSTDPRVAADFANVVAETFVARHAEIYSRPGESDFFFKQKANYDAEFVQYSKKLSDFQAKKSVYSAADQRKLLLEMQSKLQLDIAKARSNLAERRAEVQTTGEQLLKLKPILDSPYVASLVSSILREVGRVEDAESSRNVVASGIGTVPPLLLVKVYQESFQNLIKARSDIASLSALQVQQEIELKKIASELQQLSFTEGEYEKLKREVDLARSNAEIYARKATEAQVDLGLSDAKYSSVKMFDKAVVPTDIFSPKLRILVPVGSIMGLLIGALLAISLNSNSKSTIG